MGYKKINFKHFRFFDTELKEFFFQDPEFFVIYINLPKVGECYLSVMKNKLKNPFNRLRRKI